MEENREKGFKIFGDEAPEEEAIIPHINEDPPEPIVVPASGSKAMFVAVFAFCILGALLFFGYYQLSNRINRMESTGTHEIKGLNKEVDARLTALTNKLAEQRTETTKQVEALNEQLAAATKKGDKNTSAISSIEKSLTSTKQSASSTLNEVETRLSALVERFDKIETAAKQKTAGINKRMDMIGKRMDTIGNEMEENRRKLGSIDQVRQNLQNMQTRLDSVESEFNTMQANRFEPDNFRQQITSMDQQLNRRLAETETQFQQTIASLRDEVDALEAMMKSFKKMAQQSPSSDQDNIIEQEIQ